MSDSQRTSFFFNRIKELKKLVTLPLPEDFNEMVEQAYRLESDDYLEAVYEWLKQATLSIEDPHPLLPAPSPKMLGSSGIVLGNEHFTGLPYYWDKCWLNLLILGSIGKGKTNTQRHVAQKLQEQGATVWIFQKRLGDYDPLINTPLKNVYVLPQIRMNTFRPPPGVTWEHWKDVALASFCHACDLLKASHNYCLRHLNALFTQYAGTDDYPNLVDLYEFLEKNRPTSYGKDKNTYETVSNHMGAIVSSMFDHLDVKKGYPWEKLSEGQKIVVFYLPYNDMISEWIAMSLMYYIHKYREFNSRSYPPLVCMMDECKYIIREKKSRDHFIADIDKLVTSSRVMNMGFVIADHEPKSISQSILNSTETKIVFNIQADQLEGQRGVQQMLLLTWQQRNVIPTFAVSKGECLLRTADDRCPQPIQLSVPLFEYDHLMQRMSLNDLYILCKPTLGELESHVELRQRPESFREFILGLSTPNKQKAKVESQGTERPAPQDQGQRKTETDKPKTLLTDDEQLLVISVRKDPLKSFTERAEELQWSEKKLSETAHKLSDREDKVLEIKECEVGGQGGRTIKLLAIPGTPATANCATVT